MTIFLNSENEKQTNRGVKGTHLALIKSYYTYLFGNSFALVGDKIAAVSG
jgi:demethoxyubiquinone hydroxylase (CLK1/Coq7/Cat5 family)